MTTLVPEKAESPTNAMCQDREPRAIAIGLGIVLAFDVAAIVVLLMVVGNRTHDVLIALAIVFGSTFGILFLTARLMWIPWQRRYPSQPILKGSISKSMQSFALPRLCWFNNCLRITVDEEHLHLDPFAIFAPFGARRISIPWERISDVRPGFCSLILRARLDGRSISGPAWCLRLADPANGP